MSLQSSLEARHAAEVVPSCYTSGTRGSASFVEFHVTAHSRAGFPLGQLCHYTLETNAEGSDAPPERLTLAFPTADVVVFGVRLGKLVEAMHEHALSAVMPLDARYAGTLGKQPWVARIVIARVDKSGGAVS